MISDTIQLITRMMQNVELDLTGSRNCPHNPNMPFPIVPDLASLIGNDQLPWEEGNPRRQRVIAHYRLTQKALS